MKKIFLFILIIISINGLAQYPITQSMASANTRLQVNGAVDARKGLINGVYVDTSAANSDQIDFYDGAQIWTTSDNNIWLRDAALSIWIRMAKFSDVTAGSITADNGLNMSTATNVQLGGTLLQNTLIDGSSKLTIETDASQSLVVNNISLGIPISATSLGGATAGYFATINGSTNTVLPMLLFSRGSSGTPANGIGTSVDFEVMTSTGAGDNATRLISKWSTATHATRTSQLIITGVNSAVTGDILTLNGNKSIKFNGYGSGTFTGTATKFLAVDASGNVIEEDDPGGGGRIDSTRVVGDELIEYPHGESPFVITEIVKYNFTGLADYDLLRYDAGNSEFINTNIIENIRWKARVGSTTSSGTPTINTDDVDIYKLTAQAADITSFTTNLSGTPNDGDILEIQITGTAARAITWGASFVSSTVTLPATTVTTATLTVILQYYTTSSYGNNKWVCVNYY